MRRRRITHDKLNIMNRNIINSFINEVYDSPQRVDYVKKINYFSYGYFLDTYIFKTKTN